LYFRTKFILISDNYISFSSTRILSQVFSHSITIAFDSLSSVTRISVILKAERQVWQYVTVRCASTVRSNFKLKVRYVGTVRFKKYTSVRYVDTVRLTFQGTEYARF